MDQEVPQYADRQAGQSSLSSSNSSKWYENTLVVCLALSAGLIFLDRHSIIFVFPQIQHELRVNHAQLGMLMGVTSPTWALSSIVISYISDALGGRAKLIILLCLVGFSCATGLIAVTTSFAGLLVLRAIAGMFFGPAAPLMLSVAAKASSPHRLGANVGAVGAGMVLFGNAVAPALVTVLASTFGWHRAFAYLAVPGLLLALILAVLIKPDAPAKGDVLRARDRMSLRETIGLLANRNLALALIGGFALIGFLITFPSFTPLFLGKDHTMSTETRTILLTVMGLCFGIGNFFIPLLSDRLPRKTCALAAAFCTMLLPVLLIVMHQHHLILPLVLAVQFVAGGAMPMIVFIIPSESVPRRLAATAFALPLSVGELLGGSTTPGIAGMLSDHYGLPSVMWFCCGLGAICLLAVFAMREPPRRADIANEASLLSS